MVKCIFDKNEIQVQILKELTIIIYSKKKFYT